MAHPGIWIITDRHTRTLCAELGAILRLNGQHNVSEHDAPDIDVTHHQARPPSLVIPFLPETADKTPVFLGKLERAGIHTRFLAVVQTSRFLDALGGFASRTMDVLVPPFRPQEVLARVGRVLASPFPPPWDPRKDGTGHPTALAELVGEEAVMVALKRQITRVAPTDVPVLLTGETGTGKELCARAIHELSERRQKPFLPINCGAVPVDLFESELFGRRKGAFTGASATQLGCIAQAESGTLFLDEIETLPLNAQAKLLRFLQDRSYYPVGSPSQVRADVRILASTNMDLSDMVRNGTFRKDLLYRLAVMTLVLPALRHHPGDIPLLIEHFWQRYSSLKGDGLQRWLSPSAWECLCHYEWPGNARELENVIRHVLILSEREIVERADLPLASASVTPDPRSFKEAKAHAVTEFERTYIRRLMHLHRGNISQAARTAQKERRAFGRLVKKYRLNVSNDSGTARDHSLFSDSPHDST